MICVKLAAQSTNLCTVSGVGACSFLPENQVLLLDPSCSAGLVVLQSHEVPAPTSAYDYTQGAAFYSFGLTAVLVLYFMSHGIGLVFKSIKKF